jgi:hypothetical protein
MCEITLVEMPEDGVDRLMDKSPAIKLRSDSEDGGAILSILIPIAGQ